MRLRVFSAPAHERVRVYSVQEAEALERAALLGYLTPDPSYLDDDDNRQWKRAYDWMRARMAEQIEGYSGEYPMWAWLKRPNERQSCRCEDCVLITAEVPRGRFVMSDYGTWHSALNGWYLHLDEAAFDADDDVERSREEIEESWRYCLNMADHVGADRLAWLGGPSILPQLCIDRIHLEEIVSMRPWRGRRRD